VRIDLLLAGYGHVGQRFARMLEESRADLAALDITPVIVGVSTGRRGGVFDGAGLDPDSIARRLTEGDADHPASVPPTLELITRLCSQDVEARVLIETTPLDVRSGEPAISHVRAAIAGGAHVVTANKGPAAWAYATLAAAAEAAGVSFLCEGAVMDGIPVLNLVRETMPCARILGFRGVVNSTTNVILTALEQGEPFDAALARMQEAGVAEADPSYDVDGWDAAAKAAVLANVLMGASLTPLDVKRQGLDQRTAEAVAGACAAGRRLKLVAEATRDAHSVRASVTLQSLTLDDPLAILDGQANALELQTEPAGRIVITQRDGGLEKTAYALLADLVTVARRVGRARVMPPGPAT
jgi:homoserine dehydrogenase